MKFCTTFINPQSVLVSVNYKKICCLEGVFYHYHLIGFPQELSKVVVHPKFRPKCRGTISGETGLRTVSDHTIDFGVRARQSTGTTKAVTHGLPFP